jgi:hypothetical protein
MIGLRCFYKGQDLQNIGGNERGGLGFNIIKLLYLFGKGLYVL